MTSDDETTERPEWHALLAPVPADARVGRQPVASPGVLASVALRALAEDLLQRAQRRGQPDK